MAECFKCGRAGHWSNACPDAGGGGSGRERASTKSRGRGRGGKTKSSRSTGGAGGGGGGASGGEFTFRLGSNQVDTDGSECFKCGQTGHWANACPDEGGGGRTAARGASRGGGGGGASSSKGGKLLHTSLLCAPLGEGPSLRDALKDCFKCNQPGHWANACPNEDGGGSRRRR